MLAIIVGVLFITAVIFSIAYYGYGIHCLKCGKVRQEVITKHADITITLQSGEVGAEQLADIVSAVYQGIEDAR